MKHNPSSIPHRALWTTNCKMANADNLLPIKLTDEGKLYFVANSTASQVWLDLPDVEEVKTLEYFSERLNKAREFNLGKVTGDHFVSDFHYSTYLQLARMSRVLCRGFYKDKTGMFTKALSGPRGVAKTTCLRNFASTAPLLGSNVMSYFFSVPSADSVPERVLEAGSLCMLVFRELFDESHTCGKDAMQVTLVQTLEAQEVRLVLMVDGVDQLFKSKPTANQRYYEFAYKSLSELATLGTSTCGRLMIVLSGSSSRLSIYIKGTRSDLSRDEIEQFPILSRQINMNSSRFKSLTVVLPRPDSIDNALAILHPSQNLLRPTSFPKDALQNARKRMFVGGCNPRNLEDSDNSGSSDILPYNHACRKLWTQLLFLWFGHRDNRRLLVELGRRSQGLSERWRHGIWRHFQCEDCKKKASKCIHAIEEYAWEGKFTPVSIVAMYSSRAKGPELQFELETLQHEGQVLIINDEVFPVYLEKFEKNLKAWAPSFRQLLMRRCVLFCSSPLDQVEAFDGVSSVAKDLVKEAISAGISAAG